jgi:hypothetical protein
VWYVKMADEGGSYFKISEAAALPMIDSTLVTSSGSGAVITNPFFPGQNFHIQRYQSRAGECLKKATDRHVIVQITEPAAWAERRDANGRWVRYLKERGSLVSRCTKN